MSKKGMKTVGVITIVMILAAAMVFSAWLLSPKEYQALPPSNKTGGTGDVQQSASSDLISQAQSGNAVTMSLTAKDRRASDQSAQVSVPFYLLKKTSSTVKNIDGGMTGISIYAGADGASTKLSGTATVNAERKDTAILYAFNTSLPGYFSDPDPKTGSLGREIYLDGDSPSENFYVQKWSPALAIYIKNRFTNVLSSTPGGQGTTTTINITASPSTPNTEIEYVQFYNNNSFNAYPLGGMAINASKVINNSRISTVTFADGAAVNSAGGSATILPGAFDSAFGIKASQTPPSTIFPATFKDFVYQFSSTLILGPGDSVTTPGLNILIGGQGCTDGLGSEAIRLMAIDTGCIRSTQGEAIYCNRIATDAATPVDLGATNTLSQSPAITCK